MALNHSENVGSKTVAGEQNTKRMNRDDYRSYLLLNGLSKETIEQGFSDIPLQGRAKIHKQLEDLGLNFHPDFVLGEGEENNN